MSDTVHVVLECPEWAQADLERHARRAVAATLGALDVSAGRAELSVMGCDDARIAALNADFRGKDTPTNVLSWPAQTLASAQAGAPPSRPSVGPDGAYDLGDIAIAYETCAREARESGKPLAAHTTHLIVHGTLHLFGYDHETQADAALMERLEVEILGNLGLDNPYTSDTASTGAP